MPGNETCESLHLDVNDLWFGVGSLERITIPVQHILMLWMSRIFHRLNKGFEAGNAAYQALSVCCGPASPDRGSSLTKWHAVVKRFQEWFCD